MRVCGGVDVQTVVLIDGVAHVVDYTDHGPYSIPPILAVRLGSLDVLRMLTREQLHQVTVQLMDETIP